MIGTLATRRFWSRYGMLLAGALIVVFMSLAAILAPAIAPYDPSAIDVEHLL
jgi:peptide/nickel transport system permease protein